MNLNFLASLSRVVAPRITAHASSAAHPADRSRDDARCFHFFPSGRRCRQAVSPGDPHLCLTHARTPDPPPSADAALAAELAAAAGDFSSPANVNHVLK